MADKLKLSKVTVNLFEDTIYRATEIQEYYNCSNPENTVTFCVNLTHAIMKQFRTGSKLILCKDGKEYSFTIETNK